MQHITILVPEGEGNNLSSIVGSYKILTRANEFFKQKGGKKNYQIQLVGSSKQVRYYDGLFSVKPQVLLSRLEKTHLIIIPSLNHQFQKTIKKNQKMVEWMERQYREGAEIASMCTGAFLLASSGLLNGRSCSTHWSAADTFQKMFPKVKLTSDKLITYEKGIYTNGGAYSFLNLLLYLIEKYFDRQTAVYCSKVFQIEMDRSSQSEFIIFRGQKQHDDEIVMKAQELLENSLDSKISTDELSARFAVGRRNFDRRFIKATGNTPLEYAQRVKMEAAKRAFETSRKNVNEVMYSVGYTDLKAFRQVFRKMTGMSPLEYRNKYSNDLHSRF